MKRTWIRSPVGLVSTVVLLASCGGEAVVDVGGGGQAGVGSTSTTTSTTTPSQACLTHGDCHGDLCLFGTGLCVPACTPGACDSCGPGRFCEPCATSSCPDCDDCLPACVPITAGRCDEDDPCPGQQTCEWMSGTCLPLCSPNGDCGTFSYCDSCATGSCCGCKDCVPACLGGE